MINNKDTYSISEVTKYTGFKPHVIRFYEKEFNLDIPRSKNNRRYFTAKEIEQLLHIQKLQTDGFSNKEIKSMLQKQNNINNVVDEEIAITTMSIDNEIVGVSKSIDTHNAINFKDEIVMVLEKYNYKSEIDELNKKIEELVERIDNMHHNSNTNTDKDVLICENAKLKLKIKEKSYEIAELKESLKRKEHQQQSNSIFKRFLKLRSAH